MKNHIIEDCLNAINSSIKHFNEVKQTILKLSEFLQENDEDITSLNNKKRPSKNFEPLYLSKINYITILTLERLGIKEPTQEQIDTMEFVISMSMKPDNTTHEKIAAFIGQDTIFKRVFVRKIQADAQV